MNEDEVVNPAEQPQHIPEKANSIQVPLPERPLSVNEREVSNWINQEPDPRFKEIKQKLVDHLALVPHEVFASALKECVKKLNEQVVDKPYAVLWDYKPHSSKRWVYEQIKGDLTTQPVTETYFGAYDAMEDYESFREILDQGTDTFVVMDDAIYSGEQFRNATLKKLIEVYQKFGYYPPRMPHVILVAPYMTNGFKENPGTKSAVEHGVVSLISEHTMPALKEILSEEEKQAIEAREYILDLPDQRKPRTQLDPNDDVIYYGATLTAFDHRVADAHSFCEPLSYRLGLAANKPYAKEDTPYYKQEDEEFKAYQEKRLAQKK